MDDVIVVRQPLIGVSPMRLLQKDDVDRLLGGPHQQHVIVGHWEATTIPGEANEPLSMLGFRGLHIRSGRRWLQSVERNAHVTGCEKLISIPGVAMGADSSDGSFVASFRCACFGLSGLRKLDSVSGLLYTCFRNDRCHSSPVTRVGDGTLTPLRAEVEVQAKKNSDKDPNRSLHSARSPELGPDCAMVRKPKLQEGQQAVDVVRKCA